MTKTLFPELGFYGLPGHTTSPADVLQEVCDGEALGMGSVWLSERFDVKEFSALAGACSAVTDRLYIGSAATNINLRHPMMSAAMGSTLHRLSHGRFAFGVARGVGIRYDLWGVDKVGNAQLRDFVDMMGRLWKGERVMYDGVLGKLPYLHMGDWLQEDIPMLFVGFGPKSLEFAGSLFDGVILHTFIGDEGMTKAVECVRRGAERAGRDPAAVKIWSVVATVVTPDEERWLRTHVARMGTYLQAPGYGELLIALNGWNPEVLTAFRRHPTVASIPGGIDSAATLEQLQEIAELIPTEWMPSASGTPEQCARFIDHQFGLGADGVILHASTPAEFAPVLPEYEKLRPRARFEGRSNRPA